MSVVSEIPAIGLGMAGTPGIASRMFSSLSQAGVNIVAIAQGSSELNISVVIDEAQAVMAAQAVHDEFQLDKIGGGGTRSRDRLDVVLLGVGQIGRELLRMLPRTRRRVKPTVVGLIDRSGFVTSIGNMNSNTDIVWSRFRIFCCNVEIAIVVKYPGIN